MARFIGFDAHKSYAYVVELRDGKRLEYRVAIPGGLGDFKERLDSNAQLILEASTNSFRLADELRPHVGRLVVSDPAQTRGAASGAATTDRSSAEALARLLASDFVRPVWVPPPALRSLRNPVELRVKLARLRVGSTNRLSALSRQELVAEAKLCEEDLKAALPEDATMQEYCSALFRLRASLQEESDHLDTVFREWCRSSKEARLLMSIPGVGPLVAACVVAQVGDIKRFSCPGKLCAYAGLVPKVHSSGQSHRTGGITKAGRRSMRWAMGLAAMSASRVDESLKQFKEKLSERRPKAVAMTACARKILVSVALGRRDDGVPWGRQGLSYEWIRQVSSRPRNWTAYCPDRRSANAGLGPPNHPPQGLSNEPGPSIACRGGLRVEQSDRRAPEVSFCWPHQNQHGNPNDQRNLQPATHDKAGGCIGGKQPSKAPRGSLKPRFEAVFSGYREKSASHRENGQN